MRSGAAHPADAVFVTALLLMAGSVCRITNVFTAEAPSPRRPEKVGGCDAFVAGSGCDALVARASLAPALAAAWRAPSRRGSRGHCRRRGRRGSNARRSGFSNAVEVVNLVYGPRVHHLRDHDPLALAALLMFSPQRRGVHGDQRSRWLRRPRRQGLARPSAGRCLTSCLAARAPQALQATRASRLQSLASAISASRRLTLSGCILNHTLPSCLPNLTFFEGHC